jgi:hypothetical protein
MKLLSRRHVLRGMGMTLALPCFESFSFGAEVKQQPRRVAFVYVPNGIHMADWQLPTANATSALPSTLPATLARLERHRDAFSLLSGLTLDKARNNGDGPGDHARAAAAFLTCAQPVKADGSVLRVGVSADQVLAKAIGAGTRFPSLQLALEGGMQAGQCDSGYPCAYSSNISWATPHSPLVPEINPRQLFDRLFGTGLEELSDEDRERRRRLQRSVLDFVRKDAIELRGKLSVSDRRKLEQYLEGVRALELRIGHPGELATVDANRPEGIPQDYAEHAGIMLELLTLAFATDSTRVATFMMANEGSGRTYTELGLNEGHHALSHHADDPAKHAAIASINRFHLDLFADWLDRLREPQEDGASLLDNTSILFGSGIADGNSHEHGSLPLLLAGKGTGLTTGRHIVAPQGTPMANLYLRLFNLFGARDQSSGAEIGRFGDSTEMLTL